MLVRPIALEGYAQAAWALGLCGSVTAHKVSRDCPMVQLFSSLNAAGCPIVTKTLVGDHSEFIGSPNGTWMESFLGSLGVSSI